VTSQPARYVGNVRHKCVIGLRGTYMESVLPRVIETHTHSLIELLMRPKPLVPAQRTKNTST